MLAPKAQMPIAQAGSAFEFATPFVALNPDGSPAPGGVVYQGAIAITPGAPAQPGRALAYICTGGGSGNVYLTLADGSSIYIFISSASIPIGILPFAVTKVTPSLGVTGDFWNLV